MGENRGVGLKGWLSGPKRKETSSEPAEKLVSLDRHRIAVLPMTNISPDKQDEYFAEGITDELITTISKIRQLHVIARTSSTKYKGSGKGVSEISRELRTGSILEGTVRKSGNQLRVTAQLIDSQTEESLWSESYDRELGDVFAIQRDIARNVVESLKIQLHTEPRLDRQKEPTKDTEAYALYLKGKYFWNKGTLVWHKKALSQFERSIEKDPSFALGYSGLADVYIRMSRDGLFLPKLAYPKATELAMKAVALDGTLADPYVALAAVRQDYEWKWKKADEEFKHALELNPSHAIAHAWYALYLGHVGLCDAGIEEARRAIELDPLSLTTHMAASEEYLFARQYDKAIEEAETMIETVPEAGMGHRYRGIAEVEKGMYDEAIADFLEAQRLFGAGISDGRLGHAYGIAGKTVDAKRILDELKTQLIKATPRRPSLETPRSPAMNIGLVCLGLGDNQLALEWLGKAADERVSTIVHLKCDPIYSSIQQEPGYRELLRRIDLDH